MEHLHLSGDGKLIIQSVATLLRDSHCPATVKDSFIRLVMKCLVVFGSTLAADYLGGSGFSSVGATVVVHSLTGQWKKIKNVLKTLSR
jgi:hypothetical protein